MFCWILYAYTEKNIREFRYIIVSTYWESECKFSMQVWWYITLCKRKHIWIHNENASTNVCTHIDAHKDTQTKINSYARSKAGLYEGSHTRTLVHAQNGTFTITKLQIQITHTYTQKHTRRHIHTHTLTFTHKNAYTHTQKERPHILTL